MTAPDRAAVLRGIAAAVLQPEELLIAYAGCRTPITPRPVHGVFSSSRGRYLVTGDHVDDFTVTGEAVELVDWDGITEVVPLPELLAIAAQAGSSAAADRLGIALADHDKAHRDADRYIRKHGANGGHCLDGEQMRGPAWLALLERMHAVGSAVHAWWDEDGRAGDQLDLFHPTEAIT